MATEQPQVTCLGDEASGREQWLHEIKYDGHRMYAGLDTQLLTCTSVGWYHRYRPTIEALLRLRVKLAYIHPELCVGPTTFSKRRMDNSHTDELVLFVFNLRSRTFNLRSRTADGDHAQLGVVAAPTAAPPRPPTTAPPAGQDASLRTYAVKLDDDALAFEQQALRVCVI